jgi:site-specific DNA recombinase
MFSLFEETRTVEATLAEVNRRGWKRKSWITTKGAHCGGGPFTEGILVRLLRSELYSGFVAYKGVRYRGEQAAIVSVQQWRKVQKLLDRCTPTRRGQCNQPRTLLQGVVYCASCNRRMPHTLTNRNGKCYRYYICGNREHKCRVPAARLEDSFLEHLVAAAQSSALCKLAQRCAQQKDQVAPDLILRLHQWIEHVTYTSATGEVSIRLRERGEMRNGPA